MAQITTAELALELDTDARTARKFLRSITPRDEQPGKGSRWVIERKSLRTLKTKFIAYEAAVAARAAAQAETETDEVEDEG